MNLTISLIHHQVRLKEINFIGLIFYLLFSLFFYYYNFFIFIFLLGLLVLPSHLFFENENII